MRRRVVVGGVCARVTRCNVLFTREAHRRWGPENGADGEGLRVRSFNPGFIPRSGLFRAPREDNWFAAAALTFVAERVAKFAVPIDVGGASRRRKNERRRRCAWSRAPPPE